MPKHDAVLIGNAIVDLIAPIDEEGLSELGVEKGIMQLVDRERSAFLYEKLRDPVRTAGGSAANSAAVMAAMGAKVQYISKTAEDELGRFFADDLGALGVRYDTERAEEHETGRCMIFFTPDGERSMNTYLGASEFLHEDDIDFDAIGDAKFLYLEGYRFDGPDSQRAFERAVAACKSGGGLATITLSDPFCVERHFGAFHSLIEGGIDIVFCNEHELISYTRASDFIAACEAVRGKREAYICTAGAAGAYVINDGSITHVPTSPVTLVDATGAGDYFAGGFLASLNAGNDFIRSAKIGSQAAGEVIKIVGTRALDGFGKLLAS